MKLAFPLLITFASVSLVSAQTVTLTAKRTEEPDGWMRGGWGNYRFVLKNDGPEAKIIRWTAHWEAAGKTVGDAWGGDLDQALPAGQSVTRDEIGYLGAEVIDAAKPKPPEIVGSFTVRFSGSDRVLPFRFEVPEAVLPEPLKLIKGKTVGISVMESRYKSFKTAKRTLKWVDDCYSAMIDLTGEHPFGGKLMVYREAPEHPWWAYAGQEMILNTKFVGQTLKEFDEGILCFGWVHEVGHNFDEQIGPWYIWNGPSAEFQANFKLTYAIMNVPDRSFRMKMPMTAADYGDQRRNQVVPGQELIDRFYGVFGDKYLSDPKRSWESMNSDEIHTLFQRLQMTYGWTPFKAMYRQYRKLQDQGMKAPESMEDKVNLLVAILNRETGMDLVPTFQMWRFPVTGESVGRLATKYKL